MRKPIIGGNWKMNKTSKEAENLVKELILGVGNYRDVETVIFPPFVYLKQINNLLKGVGNIALGAQNMFWEEKGAYTAEISPGMLVDVGCRYVILGHSERREYFSETNERIQYGGSVKPQNIKELMDQSDVDGALVGGASLDGESFVKIVKYEVL